MLKHVNELQSCKDLRSLIVFANKYATKRDTYTFNFKEGLKKEKDFNKALVKVWNFALQQEGKYFLGKVGIPKRRSGGAITGLECHSEGHR